MQIFKYETDDEAQRIKDEQSANGMILVQISNITEGNFLGFTDDPNWQPRTPTEQKVADLEAENGALRRQMAQQNADFTAFQDFYFEKNPGQA